MLSQYKTLLEKGRLLKTDTNSTTKRNATNRSDGGQSKASGKTGIQVNTAVSFDELEGLVSDNFGSISKAVQKYADGLMHTFCLMGQLAYATKDDPLTLQVPLSVMKRLETFKVTVSTYRGRSTSGYGIRQKTTKAIEEEHAHWVRRDGGDGEYKPETATADAGYDDSKPWTHLTLGLAQWLTSGSMWTYLATGNHAMASNGRFSRKGEKFWLRGDVVDMKTFTDTEASSLYDHEFIPTAKGSEVLGGIGKKYFPEWLYKFPETKEPNESSGPFTLKCPKGFEVKLARKVYAEYTNPEALKVHEDRDGRDAKTVPPVAYCGCCKDAAGQPVPMYPKGKAEPRKAEPTVPVKADDLKRKVKK